LGLITAITNMLLETCVVEISPKGMALSSHIPSSTKPRHGKRLGTG